MTEYSVLLWDFEYSSEYRPGSPNIEVYIRSLKIALNIDLESIHSEFEYSAEYGPGERI